MYSLYTIMNGIVNLCNGRHSRHAFITCFLPVFLLLSLPAHAQSIPDSTFGVNGLSTILPPSGYYYTGWKVKELKDGKILTGAGCGPVIMVGRYHADGSIDSTFGVNGVAPIDYIPAGYSLSIRDMAVQRDGKILVTGNGFDTYPYLSGFVILVRIDTNGKPDSTFNGTGIVFTKFSPGCTYMPLSIAIDTTRTADSGKIYVGGRADSMQIYYMISRFNPDGTLDPSFNGTGFKIGPSMEINNAGTNFAAIQSVYALPDGKIVASGDLGMSLFAMRFKHNGEIDSTYGTNGGIILETAPDTLYSVSARSAIQPDGKLIVSDGMYNRFDSVKLRLWRLTTTGSLDATFGTGGITTHYFTQNYEYLAGYTIPITIKEDGKILASKYCKKDSFDHLLIMRLQTNGSKDTSFGIGGLVNSEPIIKDFVYNTAYIYDMTMQRDGKLLLTGQREYHVTGGLNLSLLRYKDPVKKLLGVADTHLDHYLHVYPNPADGLLNIHLKTGITGKYVISVTDISGREFLNKSGEISSAGDQQIPVLLPFNMAPGSYTLQFSGCGINESILFIRK